MVTKKTVTKTKKPTLDKKKPKDDFPLVLIGASAGGREAVSQFLKYIPDDSGAAFFYVQHLSPDHTSTLAQLLARTSQLKVLEARNGLKVEKNNLYVCTPNKDMLLQNGKIKLKIRDSEKTPYLPINDFFSFVSSLYKNRVVGIVLSGNAADGTKGLMAIKNAGGITFAQDNSAKNISMPKSAAEAGAATFILSPKEIALKLMQLIKNGLKNADKETGAVPKNSSKENFELNAIFEILHKKTGNDFSHYKITTIKRRLNFRMLHSKVSTLKEYLKLLTKNEEEADLLCKDLLINVTSFFREKETFRYLKNFFFPKLFKKKNEGETVRIWIPACSSGEEAYSIAMLILEVQNSLTKRIKVQIFATDISEQSLTDARQGDYSESDVANITKSRLKRFFVKIGNKYRIAKELRDMCVFASHNILHDPPFLRMDFISCCNLLIYFDTAAQKKSLATLTFVLSDGGYLMLGKSESVGASTHFKQLNPKFKIYCKKISTGTRKIPELVPRLPKSTPNLKSHKPTFESRNQFDSKGVDLKALDGAIDNELLSRYMPASVVINKDMEVLKFRGSASTYLSHQSGTASLNILKMVQPDFSFELRTAIQKVLKTKKPVHRSEIEIKIGNAYWRMSFDVLPLKIEWDEPLIMVVFKLYDEVKNQEGKHKTARTDSEGSPKIKQLTEKLKATRAEMYAVIETQEQANFKLQEANEEIVSANEEFQTLNEELETSKEEIEATNEELISTNQELQMRNDLLTESYRYSEAIIATVHEPMLILDNDFHVKTANKSFYKKFHVTKDETEGVSLFELGDNQWEIPELRKLLNEIVTQNADLKNLEIRHTFPKIGEKVVLLNTHRIIQKAHREQLILLAIEDITLRTLNFNKEKELLHEDIRGHQADKKELELAVKRRTREVEGKNAELESANKELTSFTYLSSHDLQEPLRKVRNFVSVLLREEETRLSANGKYYLQRTYETAKRMQTLIEDLLIYSRSKKADQKLEKTDLNLIVKEVRNSLQELIKEKKAIVVDKELGEADIIVFQFRQLFHNLIGNSLKFARAKIAVRIKIKSEIIQGEKLLNEKLSPKVQYTHITYSDNGIGFDSEHNERIFDVFQRLHNAEEYPGTGMGLAICKRIVENHKGIITASGHLNKGARFDIYIPKK